MSTRKKKPQAQKPISEEIAELRAMKVPDLVVHYEAVYGKPPRVRHRDWLWRRIAWKIQEQRFGGGSATGSDSDGSREDRETRRSVGRHHTHTCVEGPGDPRDRG